MTTGSLSATIRAVLFFVSVAAIAGTTFLWIYLYGSLALPVPEALIGITPTAVIGSLAGYYAVFG
ncbi:hypothetical protein [Natronomonas sp. EA1]|uniref:hypothetical protein n=1 Tax=Natronomonas sp. EA1 TaxID=3421655 RepID=UPI003EBA3464